MITRRSLLLTAPIGLLLPKPTLAMSLADRLMTIAPSGAPPAASGWNSGDQSHVTVSGTGNVLATIAAGGAGTNSFVRSTPTTHSTGKWAARFTVSHSVGGGYTGAGFANASYDVSSQIPGFDAAGNSFVIMWGGVADTGALRCKNAPFGLSVTVGGVPPNGYIFDVAWDVDGDKIWYRCWNPGGSTYLSDWNNISSAVPGDSNGYHPVATGGLASGPYMFVFGGYDAAADACTLDPSPTTWSDGTSLQAGFSAWG